MRKIKGEILIRFGLNFPVFGLCYNPVELKMHILMGGYANPVSILLDIHNLYRYIYMWGS